MWRGLVSMRLEGCVQHKAGTPFNACFRKHLAYYAWQVSLPQNKQTKSKHARLRLHFLSAHWQRAHHFQLVEPSARF